ncbi:MAG: hypothetical protein CMB64_07220 [Euryarchaeota archaeon]|nr:hypothetical protein [Euryarchaeota archaeon]|tara:strand:+ start:812 stop:1003 length:192 start_codon:yes stop_codon:yes gene_type:complete
MKLQLVIAIALFFFGMSIYNLYHGGVFVKNKGWKTKEERPITFWISVIVPPILAPLVLWWVLP